uniref:E3 SUMO-protein ligase PIAS2 n=1 Tax=Lygus hesperus TaxID=30085 RepID=A0A146M1N2_LYGHE
MIDKYPRCMSVEVNGTEIAADAEGPLNITRALEPVARNINVINLGFSPYLTKTYVATIFLVTEESRSSQDTEGDYFMKIIETQPPEKMEKRIQSFFSKSGEIGVNQLEVSLKCPFTLKKMVHPCITWKCSHITCFDAMSFVCYNSTRPKCPLCGVGCSFRDLLIDG